MIKWKLLLITILIMGLAIYSAYLIFPQTHTLGALKFSVGQAEITKKVNQIMSELDLIPGKYHTTMNLKMRAELIRQVQQEHGLAGFQGDTAQFGIFRPGFFTLFFHLQSGPGGDQS